MSICNLLLQPHTVTSRRTRPAIYYDANMTFSQSEFLSVLDRPLRSGFLWVPYRTWIERDRLYWTLYDPGRRLCAKQKRYGPGMFRRFIELDGKDSEAYRTYASKWGVFRLCRHDLPHMHNWPTGTKKWGCRPRGTALRQWEPLERWRGVVAEFRACLAIAAEMQAGRKGKAADWLRLGSETTPRAESKRRLLLRATVNNALYLGRVQPAIEYDNSIITTFQTGYGNLYGALALQLLLSIARTDGLANCSACGNPFVLTGRRPNPNRRCYCPACGTKAAQRDAARDYRERVRQS